MLPLGRILIWELRILEAKLKNGKNESYNLVTGIDEE